LVTVEGTTATSGPLITTPGSGTNEPRWPGPRTNIACPFRGWFGLFPTRQSPANEYVMVAVEPAHRTCGASDDFEAKTSEISSVSCGKATLSPGIPEG